MRRRGRGRRASWEWANNFNLVGSDTNAELGTQVWAVADFLPQPRVDFLCEARGTDSIVHVESLLWLDFNWTLSSLDGTARTYVAPPVDFFIIKSTEEGHLGSTGIVDYLPYGQPIVPSAITTWNSTSTEDSDGLDPYLWTHHLDIFTCNSLITNVGIEEVSGIASGQGNAMGAMSTAANQIAVMQPNMNVRMAWQPSVVVKAKRKLMKNEGLKIGMTWLGTNQNLTGAVQLNLGVRQRTLLK